MSHNSDTSGHAGGIVSQSEGNMITKTLSLLVIIGLFSAPILAGETNVSKKERKIRKRAAKVQTAVHKLGISKDSKVSLKTRDKNRKELLSIIKILKEF